jgi:hypothetical protein
VIHVDKKEVLINNMDQLRNIANGDAAC